MAGVEEILINDTYLVIIALSVLFTVITISRRTPLLDLLTTICWWVGASAFLVASPTTTPLYSISFLYWGFGLIFFVLMWYDLIQIFNFKKLNKGVGVV